MHFLTIVKIDSKENIEAQVENALEPFSEHLEVDERTDDCWACSEGKTEEGEDCEHCNGSGETTYMCNENSFWDWWQIGGRWTGYFAAKMGLDYSPEEDPRNIVGGKVTWPTEWAEYEKDVVTVEELGLFIYDVEYEIAVIDGLVYRAGDGDKPLLSLPKDSILVTVDCHC